MKIKIYKILFTILCIAVIVVIGLIAIKYTKNYLNNQENKKIVETFARSISENQEEVTMNGYKVIGVIKIPKIQIEYPILDIDTYNPEETKEPMKISIVKYWGGNVNQHGNLSIAGHNNYDGTMFGKTKKMNKGDVIELTDLENNTVKYQIYDKFVTNPNDVTILATNDKTVREVTLITCTNDSKRRVIAKFKEVM